jgi:hypothetical protein
VPALLFKADMRVRGDCRPDHPIAMARANSADVLPMGSSSSRRYLSQTRLSATKSLRDRQCGISLLQ